MTKPTHILTDEKYRQWKQMPVRSTVEEQETAARRREAFLWRWVMIGAVVAIVLIVAMRAIN